MWVLPPKTTMSSGSTTEHQCNRRQNSLSPEWHQPSMKSSWDFGKRDRGPHDLPGLKPTDWSSDCHVQGQAKVPAGRDSAPAELPRILLQRPPDHLGRG